MQGKVSMVIPCYNKENYIDNMLHSVYKQTWNNIELIIVNDGSTDGTHEIITHWKPRFIERGFEVIIIEQENLGVAAAVRNGMLRMTGDYLCQVDCDDELLPDYLTIMAGWLDQHPEYDWAGCGHTYVSASGVKKKERPSFPITYSNPQIMMENYLMRRSFDVVIWVYVVRSKYLSACKVVENYDIDSRLTQEPSFLLPLFCGGGRLKYFPQVLYRYYDDISPNFPYPTVSISRRYRNAFLASECRVINKLNLPVSLKRRLISIAKLFYFKHFLFNSYQASDFRQHKSSIESDLLEFVNTMFTPSPMISSDKIQYIGHIVLFQAIENCIWRESYKPEVDRTLIKTQNTRMVGYGALSKFIGNYFHLLNGTPFLPSELWDADSKPGDVLHGIPIVKPDIDSLKPDVTILVLPPSRSAISIEKMLDKKEIINYITSNELLDYLSYKYLPELYDGCVFIGNPNELECFS